MQMIEELFEDADISFVVPEEELMYTVIEERYLVGEVMAVGHIGRVHSGKRNFYFLFPVELNLSFHRLRENKTVRLLTIEVAADTNGKPNIFVRSSVRKSFTDTSDTVRTNGRMNERTTSSKS